jgi:multimeric flavodoxin WrbA
MKILAICGSHHRGNTYSVLNTIQDDFPDIDYQLLMLHEVNLEQCRGCYVCIRKGEQYCPLKDDRDMIINEMSDADGIVFASPVYVNFITSLMKQFIERLGFMSHRPPAWTHDKFAMVMAVYGGFGGKESNKYMNGIFTSFGMNVVASLELQIATKSEQEQKYNHEQMMNTFNTLIGRIKKGERNPPTMTQLILFNLYKSISEYAKEYFEADYQYYKDKTNYHYDTDINSDMNMKAKQIVQKEIQKMMDPSLR